MDDGWLSTVAERSGLGNSSDRGDRSHRHYGAVVEAGGGESGVGSGEWGNAAVGGGNRAQLAALGLGLGWLSAGSKLCRDDRGDDLAGL
ncbi:hypothetical protein C7B82_23465 [Stenomitos frigidus ULC18]|uniref:Uncharacterized protein n=1 Tax=Stenomitos frigidus ULC18 TaxID=2107698 RepID=A0A2T1DXU2_9CYAN|nr:hypothetical protein C7B82_23465 [Stenomitos frigidus ULC18]